MSVIRDLGPISPMWASPWIRGALLSTGMLASLAAGMALQTANVRVQELRPSALAKAAVATTQGVAQSRAVQESAWRVWQMDTRLSLSLLKPILPGESDLAATRVSLSSPFDPSDEAVSDAAGHPTDEQPQALAVASSTPAAGLQQRPLAGASSVAPLMIDPPAAGRAQTSAMQAVESYRHALDLLDQGRDGQALEALQSTLRLDPTHSQARRLAVTLALDAKQAELASRLVDEGLKVDPRDPDLQFLQARRLMSGGAADQALKVLQGMERPTGEALGLKAGLLARSGQYGPAAQAYEQALRTRPDNATWWLGLGVAWQAQGQGAQAKEAFYRAYRLGQLSPDVQAWLEQQL
ncbi:tetratricopeptide repeat protein [Aquabacterium sp.]|uniref:tetratricopeptide repeat protein n=1 Tax=Aquabacterium sp. TaxID=1872578 RepID=UPI002E2F7BF3|nr:tetratricopeptide repeat protein [Aquabacterium sp.]HEX5311627.1 tetratricopeptide repeat protein [Aquabacterium sp.]